jgi:hypothetical protein
MRGPKHASKYLGNARERDSALRGIKDIAWFMSRRDASVECRALSPGSASHFSTAAKHKRPTYELTFSYEDLRYIIHGPGALDHAQKNPMSAYNPTRKRCGIPSYPVPSRPWKVEVLNANNYTSQCRFLSETICMKKQETHIAHFIQRRSICPEFPKGIFCLGLKCAAQQKYEPPHTSLLAVVVVEGACDPIRFDRPHHCFLAVSTKIFSSVCHRHLSRN